MQPEQFGFTPMDLFDEELELWKQRAADSPGFEGTVADAWNSELDVAKLLPFFLRVLCMFGKKAGISREFPFGVCLAMAPWVCHRVGLDRLALCVFWLLVGFVGFLGGFCGFWLSFFGFVGFVGFVTLASWLCWLLSTLLVWWLCWLVGLVSLVVGFLVSCNNGMWPLVVTTLI